MNTFLDIGENNYDKELEEKLEQYNHYIEKYNKNVTNLAVYKIKRVFARLLVTLPIWLILEIIVSIREGICLSCKAKYNSIGKEIIKILVNKYNILNVSKIIEILSYPGIAINLLEKMLKPKGELNYLSFNESRTELIRRNDE